MSVTADEACRYNAMMIEKLARHMAQIVKQRLNEGDINLVHQAAEKLAELMYFRRPCHGANIVTLLENCDASRWLDFIYCGSDTTKRVLGGYTRAGLMKLVTGKTGREWLEYQEKTCRHPDYNYPEC
jgi:hypothetical protein